MASEVCQFCLLPFTPRERLNHYTAAEAVVMDQMSSYSSVHDTGFLILCLGRRSRNPTHMKESLQLWDFELSAAHMARIQALDGTRPEAGM